MISSHERAYADKSLHFLLLFVATVRGDSAGGCSILIKHWLITLKTHVKIYLSSAETLHEGKRLCVHSLEKCKLILCFIF